jgi:hypothetical protein
VRFEIQQEKETCATDSLKQPLAQSLGFWSSERRVVLVKVVPRELSPRVTILIKVTSEGWPWQGEQVVGGSVPEPVGAAQKQMGAVQEQRVGAVQEQQQGAVEVLRRWVRVGQRCETVDRDPFSTSCLGGLHALASGLVRLQDRRSFQMAVPNKDALFSVSRPVRAVLRPIWGDRHIAVATAGARRRRHRLLTGFRGKKIRGSTYKGFLAPCPQGTPFLCVLATFWVSCCMNSRVGDGDELRRMKGR